MTGGRWVVLVWALLPAGVEAAESWPGEAVDAATAYDSGDYETAIRGYEAAIGEGDHRPELPFNLGTALFKEALRQKAVAGSAGATPGSLPGAGGPVGPTGPPLGSPSPGDDLIQAAVERFAAAAGTGDPGLRARALSNAGTVEATRGNVDDAIERYKEALRLDPTDTRARYNLEFLLSQPPPESSESPNGDPSNDSESESPPESQDASDPSDPNDPNEPNEPNEPGEDEPSDAGEEPPPPDESEGGEDDAPPEDSPAPAEPRDEEGMSEEAARRELDRLEELEREIMKELLARRRQQVAVEKDW